MLKLIFRILVVLFILAFIGVWLLSGGIKNISTAASHYRNPLKYGNLYNYFFQIGSTTGMTFTLPGTPSTYPTVSIVHATTSTTVHGPNTIYQSGTSEPQGVENY
jgi:hypothetical protein